MGSLGVLGEVFGGPGAHPKKVRPKLQNFEAPIPTNLNVDV